MFGICLKILKKKKKDLLIIVSITVVLSFISVIAFTVAKDINFTKKNEGFASYGSFVAAGSTEDKRELPTSDLLKIGQYKVIDTIEYNNSFIPIGVIDDDFYDLTSAKIVDGRHPKEKNEIAVQSYVLKLMGKKLNDSVKIDLNGAKQEFIITGIINNYSMTLSTGLERGNANYPAIIVGDKYDSGNGRISYLIGYKDRNTIGYDDMKEQFRLYQITGEIPIDYYNDNLFFKGFMYCAELEFFSSFFNVTVFILAGIVSAILYFFFFKNLKKNQAVFMTLGDVRNIKKIAVTEIITVCIVSFISSLCFFSVFFIIAFSNELFLFKTGAIFLCIWYLIYSLLEIIICLIILNKASRNPVMENLVRSFRNKNGRTSKQTKYKLLNVIKYSLIFIITFLCIFYVIVLHESFQGLPDYQLISQEAFLSEIVNGYSFKKSETMGYGIDEINDIVNRYDGVRVELVPDTGNNVLVCDRSYHNDFINGYTELYSYEEDTEEHSDIFKKWPKKADEYIPVNNVKYLILSDEEYRNLLEDCDLSTEENGLVMYVPVDYDPKIDVSHLGFAGFEIDEGIEFKKYDMTIEHVINKSMIEHIEKNTRDYSYELFSADINEIVIFLNYDDMNKYPITKSYSQAFITFESGFSDKESLDNDLGYLQSKVQGGVIYSKKEDERRAESFNQYIKNVSIALLTISVCIAVVYSVSSIILYIRNNRKKLGIQMVLGKIVKKLVFERLLSNAGCLLLSFIIGSIVIIVFAFDGGNAVLCLKCGFISLIITSLIMFFDIVIYGCFLKKVKIKDCIYN